MDEIEHGHRRGAQAEQEAEIVHQQHGALPRVTLSGCQRGPDEVKQGFEVGGAPAGIKKRARGILPALLGAEIAPKCWGIGEKSLSEQQKRGLP